MSLWESLDIGGIAELEHLNLEVPNFFLSKIFYLEGLGFTLDPFSSARRSVTFWYNVGYQQFHIVVCEGKPAQVVDGHIGLVFPNLSPLLQRLKKIEPQMKDTHFKFELVEEEKADGYRPVPVQEPLSYVKVTCPWGNVFHIYENNERIDFRGGLGTLYVQFNCPVNSVDDISEFYKQNFGALTVVEKSEHGNLVRIIAGVKQQIIFKEHENVDPTKDRGYHVAIYISDFSNSYKKVQEQKLEKLPGDTLAEVLKERQFRFDKISWNGKQMLVLEHETRSMHHKHYLRPLINAIPTN
eukprot:TRINITY_DN3268_c0_g1_i1.p1 TRINITY_DN3268_c0_g1~~TRINITY_DN3268_c0_g1_i1.p1  ORF type:complete len:297 (-),score=49.55 TRINITY_DN3268_c0_g1_i1:89-979(-)